MNQEETAAIDRRLARIEGQVRGVRRLLAEGAYCCDILNQLAAVTSALNQASAAIASQHIKHCVLGDGAHPSAQSMSREELLDELDDVLKRLAKA